MAGLLHRGWWLATSVYLVVDAGLLPSQLVLSVAGIAVPSSALVAAGAPFAITILLIGRVALHEPVPPERCTRSALRAML